MSRLSYFIENEADFARISGLVGNVVDLDARLPSSPFKKSWLLGGFDETDWAISGPFWPELQKLALQSEDDTIILAVLDPDPVEYYYHEFGFYCWAVIPTSVTEDEYWSIIDAPASGQHSDSVVFGANVVVLTVPSGKWAIWCERECEIMVLGSSMPELKGVLKDFDWVKEFSYNQNAVWLSFVQELRKNFQPHVDAGASG